MRDGPEPGTTGVESLGRRGGGQPPGGLACIWGAGIPPGGAQGCEQVEAAPTPRKDLGTNKGKGPTLLAVRDPELHPHCQQIPRQAERPTGPQPLPQPPCPPWPLTTRKIKICAGRALKWETEA